MVATLYHRAQSNHDTPCRSGTPLQDRYPDSCRAAQLLCAEGTQAGCVPIDPPLRWSLCNWSSWLLGHKDQDSGDLRPLAPFNQGTTFKSDASLHNRCPGSCRAAQLPRAVRTQAGCVLSNPSLWCPLHTWLSGPLCHRTQDGGNLSPQVSI